MAEVPESNNFSPFGDPRYDQTAKDAFGKEPKLSEDFLKGYFEGEKAVLETLLNSNEPITKGKLKEMLRSVQGHMQNNK